METAYQPEAAVEFVMNLVQRLYSDDPMDDLVSLASYPIMVQSPGNAMTLTTATDLHEALSLFRQAKQALGLVGVKSEVVSISATGQGLHVITLLNKRLGEGGKSLGQHRSTYVTDWVDGCWRIRSLSVGDNPSDAHVREAIERFFLDEFKGAMPPASECQTPSPGGAV